MFLLTPCSPTEKGQQFPSLQSLELLKLVIRGCRDHPATGSWPPLHLAVPLPFQASEQRVACRPLPRNTEQCPKAQDGLGQRVTDDAQAGDQLGVVLSGPGANKHFYTFLRVVKKLDKNNI